MSKKRGTNVQKYAKILALVKLDSDMDLIWGMQYTTNEKHLMCISDNYLCLVIDHDVNMVCLTRLVIDWHPDLNKVIV